jgi:hypothetical protein
MTAHQPRPAFHIDDNEPVDDPIAIRVDIERDLQPNRTGRTGMA